MRFDSDKAALSDNGQLTLTIGILTTALSSSDRALIFVFSDIPTACSVFRTWNKSRFFTLPHSNKSAVLFAASPNLPVSLRALLLLVLMGVSEDIQEYLFWAKSAEEDVWLRDDIAIAIRTVALAAEGCQEPYTVATYEVLGCYPNQLQERIEDRRRALLGDLYEAFHGVGAATSNSSDPLPPRKSPQPEIAKKAVA